MPRRRAQGRQAAESHRPRPGRHPNRLFWEPDARKAVTPNVGVAAVANANLEAILASSTWARSCARVLTLGMAIGFVSLSGGASARAGEKPTGKTEETVAACVDFVDEQGDKQLLVTATNSCEKRLSCRIDFVVRCTDLDGKPTSSQKKRAPFALSSKGKANVTLSANSCTQGWLIDEFSWTCA